MGNGFMNHREGRRKICKRYGIVRFSGNSGNHITMKPDDLCRGIPIKYISEIPTAEDFVNLIFDRDVRVLCTVAAKTAEKNFTFLHLHAGRKGEIIMLRYKARQ